MTYRKLLVVIALFLIAALVLSGCNLNQPPLQIIRYGNLKVLLKDEQSNPLAGAKVVSNNQPEGQMKVTGMTGDDGSVTFNGIRAGRYEFYISLYEFEQKHFEVNVSWGQTATITLTLTKTSSPSPVPSPS